MPDNFIAGLAGFALMGIAVLATVGLFLYIAAQLSPRGTLAATPAPAGKTVLAGFYVGLIGIGIIGLAFASIVLWGFKL